MIKPFFHSLFSIAFFVVRFFVLDGAASPAYAKTQLHNPPSPVTLTAEDTIRHTINYHMVSIHSFP